MLAEKKMYPQELEFYLRLDNLNSTALCGANAASVRRLCTFIEPYKYDFEEVFISGARPEENLKAFLEKYEDYSGFIGSVLHKHLCAYICTLENEKDNDIQKGIAAQTIFDDHRKLRLIMEYIGCAQHGE